MAGRGGEGETCAEDSCWFSLRAWPGPWGRGDRRCSHETTIGIGNLKLTFGSTFSPKALPKATYAPITVEHREDRDRPMAPIPSALPRSRTSTSTRTSRSTSPACRSAKPASSRRRTPSRERSAARRNSEAGSAHAEIAFPEQKPLLVKSPLTVFNGGEKGGKVDALDPYLHHRAGTGGDRHHGHDHEERARGLHSIAKVPVIAGGSGSAIDFSFKFGEHTPTKARRWATWKPNARTGTSTSTPEDALRERSQYPRFRRRRSSKAAALHAEGLVLRAALFFARKGLLPDRRQKNRNGLYSPCSNVCW